MPKVSVHCTEPNEMRLNFGYSSDGSASAAYVVPYDLEPRGWMPYSPNYSGREISAYAALADRFDGSGSRKLSGNTATAEHGDVGRPALDMLRAVGDASQSRQKEGNVSNADCHPSDRPPIRPSGGSPKGLDHNFARVALCRSDAFSYVNLESEEKQRPGITVKTILEEADRFRCCTMRAHGVTVIDGDEVRYATPMDLHELKMSLTPKRKGIL